MKFRYLLPFLIGSILFSSSPILAQLVGDNAFLQGHWLEVAIAPNGSWGNTVPVPAGYHTRSGSSLTYADPITGTTPSGNGLDFSYDQGHDGWATGTVPFYGAYFLPGTPFNGWSIQLDDTMSSAFYSSGEFDTTLGGIFGGTVASYSGPSCWNPHAPMAGTWKGTVGLHRAGLRNALQVEQTNEVDTNASWLNVTTKFYNTTDSTLKGVYYFASADPDNDEILSGDFRTDNHVAYQGGPLNRHEVWGRGLTYRDAFSGLATQDCRAQVLIYQSWPPAMVTGNDLDKVFAGTTTSMGTCYYALGATTLAQDIAFGIVFNVGNIAPHDSAFITYAWIFADTSSVDSLFQLSPQLSTTGKVYSLGNADSVFQCTLSGCGTTGDSLFTADIINGENRDWGLSTWTWAPSIGLSSTVGTHVVVDFNQLTAAVTYTITGTQNAGGSCRSTKSVSFTLYAQPCFTANSNTPCLGDTLQLHGTSDTTGYVFNWTGPTGFTSTGLSTTRYPVITTDTGRYYLIRTIGTHNDTVSTYVVYKNIPIVTAGSNSPVCSGGTLLLTATPDSVGETFTWSGPNSFGSTLQNPGRPLIRVIDSGWYRVITNWKGCTDSGFVDVKIDSTPAIPSMGSNSPVCSQHGTLLLTSGDATPGVTYRWSGPPAFTSTLQNPSISYISTFPPGGTPTSFGTFTVTATLGHCSDSNTITVEVDSTPAIPVLTSNAPVCSGNALNLTATSLTGSAFNWTGPNSFTAAAANPTINPVFTPATGIYSVTATFTYSGTSCTSDVGTLFVQIDSTPQVPSATSNSPGAPDSSICQGDTLKLYSADSTAGVTYAWTGANSFTSTDQNPIVLHVLPSATGTYTVTVELGGKCPVPTVITVSITPTPPLTATSNSPVCSGIADSLFLQAASAPGATFSWNGPYTFFSTYQNPMRSPVLTEYSGIYQVTATQYGCSATVNDTVVINKTPPAPWMKWLTFCQFYPPDPIQAMGDNILWYTSSMPPLSGSKTPQIPNTAVLGETWYYATQTVSNCVSAMDSLKVTIFPKPVISVSASVGVCPHDTTRITVKDTDPLAYYHWYPALYLSDTASPSVLVRAETDIHYTVVASNMYGCTDTGNVAVTVNAGAVLNLGDSVTLYPGEKYQISPSTNCIYFSWFPSAGLDNAHISNPMASPEVSTKYIVTGMTGQGCKVVDSIDIYVSPGSLLAIPNAFTPGNGPNGIFKIIKRGIATLQNFSIFDRWGVKVFQTSDIDQGWDGTYKGVPQPFGVYVYEINAVTSTGEGFVRKGNVTLIR